MNSLPLSYLISLTRVRYSLAILLIKIEAVLNEKFDRFWIDCVFAIAHQYEIEDFDVVVVTRRVLKASNAQR